MTTSFYIVIKLLYYVATISMFYAGFKVGKKHQETQQRLGKEE